MRVDTKAATGIEVSFSKDIFVEWPALFQDKGWSLWDRRPVRQGAHHKGDFRTFKEAEKAALELLGS